MSLTITDLSCGYHGVPLFSNFNLTVDKGDIVCLLGPNGVGKTTLFKTILGFIRPESGHITIDGKDSTTLSRRTFAAHVAYVPQTSETPFPLKTIDVVLTGCAGQLSIFDTPHETDYKRAHQILNELGVDHLSHRQFDELSGGERQMVLIARALMQNAQILIMDEPTSALDFGNQMRVLSCVKHLAQHGHGILMTSHNPDHAYLCGSSATLIMDNGSIVSGSVEDVVTADNLQKTYHIDIGVYDVQEDDGTHIRTCIPHLT
jgi:iron complex transport system ATP-binding protein